MNWNTRYMLWKWRPAILAFLVSVAIYLVSMLLSNNLMPALRFAGETIGYPFWIVFTKVFQLQLSRIESFWAVIGFLLICVIIHDGIVLIRRALK